MTESMLELLSQPWPWYIAGPLIGLLVPVLLFLENRQFGVSANLSHMCAATVPGRVSFFQYDWKRVGLWNLTLVAGMMIGGFLAYMFIPSPEPIALSEATRADLSALGLTDLTGMVPQEIFSWSALTTPTGFITLVVGGFLVGFGARYAGGCTSGHAISGLADLQLPSLIAVVGFFAGGLLTVHLILPLLF